MSFTLHNITIIDCSNQEDTVPDNQKHKTKLLCWVLKVLTSEIATCGAG